MVSVSQNQGEGILQKRAPIIWNQGRFDLTSHQGVEKDYCKIRCNPNFSANLEKSDLHKDWEFQWENDKKNKMAKNHFAIFGTPQNAQNGSFWVFWGVPKMELPVPESKF